MHCLACVADTQVDFRLASLFEHGGQIGNFSLDFLLDCFNVRLHGF